MHLVLAAAVTGFSGIRCLLMFSSKHHDGDVVHAQASRDT